MIDPPKDLVEAVSALADKSKWGGARQALVLLGGIEDTEFEAIQNHCRVIGYDSERFLSEVVSVIVAYLEARFVVAVIREGHSKGELLDICEKAPERMMGAHFEHLLTLLRVKITGSSPELNPARVGAPGKWKPIRKDLPN